ncbi:MAG: hydroxymethylbilane synthase, partial [Solirubrobacterales bacterium]
DKERFVRGVEAAVLDGRAGVGVHSAKDLPGRMTSGLAIAAVPPREDARDVWLGPGGSLDEVPQGATVGTASLRRRSQLLALRPDLRPVEIRGNVDTRIRKLREGMVDGLVLALAGLRRLDREEEAAFTFDLDQMMPAAGQGALVVQCRDGGEDEAGRSVLNDFESERRLLAERAVVTGLDADCSSPLGIYARIQGDGLRIDGYVGLVDGSQWIRDTVEGSSAHPEAVGAELARRMIAAGARELLQRAAEDDPRVGDSPGVRDGESGQ